MRLHRADWDCILQIASWDHIILYHWIALCNLQFADSIQRFLSCSIIRILSCVFYLAPLCGYYLANSILFHYVDSTVHILSCAFYYAHFILIYYVDCIVMRIALSYRLHYYADCIVVRIALSYGLHYENWLYREDCISFSHSHRELILCRLHCCVDCIMRIALCGLHNIDYIVQIALSCGLYCGNCISFSHSHRKLCWTDS